MLHPPPGPRRPRTYRSQLAVLAHFFPVNARKIPCSENIREFGTQIIRIAWQFSTGPARRSVENAEEFERWSRQFAVLREFARWRPAPRHRLGGGIRSRPGQESFKENQPH